MVLETAILCAALNAHHEARGEPLLGQFAVTHVARNRAKYDPERMCKVIFTRAQFSWTLTMRGHGSREFERAIQIAHLAWQSQAVTNGATHYHAISVRPIWTRKMVVTARIGNHIFYREQVYGR